MMPFNADENAWTSGALRSLPRVRRDGCRNFRFVAK